MPHPPWQCRSTKVSAITQMTTLLQKMHNWRTNVDDSLADCSAYESRRRDGPATPAKVPRHASHASQRYTPRPSQSLFATTDRKQQAQQREQRAFTCGGIDIILHHRLSWEDSGWRVWEIKCGNKPLVSGSNYRLSATLRQRTGLGLALLHACIFLLHILEWSSSQGWRNRTAPTET
jgi:hypothetical protein